MKTLADVVVVTLDTLSKLISVFTSNFERRTMFVTYAKELLFVSRFCLFVGF